ncbi:MAG: glycosyltransferase family 8 protein [Bacteroidetes bacterium]|nr:glycosyltransferase family 8 protein [Bacteroidota bacterium]
MTNVHQKRYSIATTADANYYVPLYVMLLSLFQSNKKSCFDVYVLYDGINTYQKNELETLAAQYNSSIKWLSFNTIDDTNTYRTNLPQYYYRIFLPELLPPSISTILYLDSDLLVLKDISALLNTDVSGFSIMGVKDMSRYNMQRLNIPEEYDYINAGVLLFNITEWRTLNYTQQLVNNIKTNTDKYWLYDQDAINSLLYKSIGYLHPCWNMLTSFYLVSKKTLRKRYNTDADSLLNDPAIVHFATSVKPWHFMSTHPYKPVFINYLSQTPYLNFAEKGSMKMIFAKVIHRIKHRSFKLIQ